MTSSTSSSSSRIAAAAFLAAAVIGGAGCAHRPASAPPAALGLEPGERLRLVVLPVENLTDGAVPVKEFQAAVEASLAPRFELVPGDELEPFLSRHRIRYTGGVDAETARAAREELHAQAVLITSVNLYRPVAPPAVALAMRLVSTGDTPIILWMDAASRAGDESPGLLGLGLVDTVKPLEARTIARLVGSLAAFVDGKGAESPGCGGGRYAPKLRYRSELLDDRQPRTLAILPFLNQSLRRGAGDAVSLQFVRHLVSTGRYRVVEPGVVRDYLLRARIMIPGGASNETTRLMLGAMAVDLVLSGVVLDFEDSPGLQGPMIRFSATMLDGGTGDVVWHSSSYNRGDDGVFAFGLGRVRTSEELSCRMIGGVVLGLVTPGSTPGVPTPKAAGAPGESALRTRIRETAEGAGR
jgi:hypothetical protein